MGLFKIIKDGFRGKPDFSSIHNYIYQIDECLLTLSYPHNINNSVNYHNQVKTNDIQWLGKIYRHEIALKLGYIQYCFQIKIIVPIRPLNSPGHVFVYLNLKKASIDVECISSLTSYLERNYFEYYHDPVVCNKTHRGRHTDIMNEAHDFAIRCWGENPESQEDIREKQEFLLGRFLRAFPPIKCEEVKIRTNTFAKYKEGNLDLTHKCSRFYNLPLKGDYYISIEFHYEIEQSMASRKFVEWVRTADENFERSILETVELSRVGDSVNNKVSRSV
ncbi:Mg-dependent DNase [Photobacterium aphoticum]|uniref:Mg-dependent DNase n=1 Tax=Photobacterium aphoticum TaxID=754436 RepID=A0A090QNV9_9GAMM|nr:Mg-dependent DNase [Photobacterium aphoticum]